MDNQPRCRRGTALLGSILLGYICASPAQSPSPLEVKQHPATPRYESLFDEGVLPLDTELSWKHRFSGNEYFNTQETLPHTSPAIDRQLGERQESSRNGGGSSAFDASGIVRQVKLADGKVKIAHGPIERLGMPEMTMLFRVEDPDRLAGLEQGTAVNFDVENTAAGFTITRIEPEGSDFDASGVVQQVKRSEGKVKVAHGPIERLGMPAMTMLFRVEDIAQLATLEKGAEIEFDVDNTAAGFIISRLRKSDDGTASSFDASGTVKAIRAEQGKVKIAHGPIDRLGMPAMTMMFKLKNPDDLASLHKDMAIEFDVVNESGGFEITRFRPADSALDTMAAESSGRQCFTIGPFATADDAAASSAALRKQGITSRTSSSRSRAYVGDMVYIDGLKNRDAALAATEVLEQNGIRDYLLLTEADKENAISLGVFSSRANAERLRLQAEALDYTVRSEARYRRQTDYWLRGRVDDAIDPQRLLSTGQAASGIRLETSRCESGEEA